MINIEEALQYEGFIFIIFISRHCPNCDDVIQKIEEIHRIRNDIKILKINIDLEYQLMEQYSIESVPTILIYCHDLLIDRIIGNVDIDRYLMRINLDLKDQKN